MLNKYLITNIYVDTRHIYQISSFTTKVRESNFINKTNQLGIGFFAWLKEMLNFMHSRKFSSMVIMFTTQSDIQNSNSS